MSDKNHQRNKKSNDKHVKEQVLNRGDRVLLRNFAVQDKHKLKCKWRPSPYVVVEKMPNLPVYQIKPERGMGSEKTVHRNYLLPIGYLVRLPVERVQEESLPKPVTRSRQQKTKDPRLSSNQEEATSSESECEEVICTRPFVIYQDELLTQTAEMSTKHSQPVIMATEHERQVPAATEPEVTDVQTPPPKATPVGNCLEGEADPNPMNVGEVEVQTVARPRRVNRPVVKLTYDELGKPGVYKDSRSSSCHTSWCHPMALCFTCSNFHSSVNSQTALVI